MNQYRRNFIFRSFLLGLACPLRLFAEQGDKPAGDTNAFAKADFAESLAAMQQKAVDFHRDLGYQLVDPKPLLTGHSFNGGLRYDDSGTLKDAPERSMIVQDCARIADIAERQRQDVLPYFHILACNWRNHNNQARIITDTLAFLLGSAGLTPQRLALVSVDALLPYCDLLAEQGIDWQRQVVIRDTETARAVGDGSGYFRPQGHPEQPEVLTASVHVWMGAGPAPAVPGYPLPAQWTEIGEMGLALDAELAHGFGLERLVYATTGLLPGWQVQRRQLLARIEAEVAASGAALPEGYYLFKDA